MARVMILVLILAGAVACYLIGFSMGIVVLVVLGGVLEALLWLLAVFGTRFSAK